MSAGLGATTGTSDVLAGPSVAVSSADTASLGSVSFSRLPRVERKLPTRDLSGANCEMKIGMSLPYQT